MRAIRHHAFGNPADELVVEEVPLPEPNAGEVRVRTVLATIHNHDLYTVRGIYGFKPEFPALSGTEATGVIDAVGAGVTSLAVGQRVAAGGVFGVWAEYFVARAEQLVPLTDAISDELGAQLVSMPSSALMLLNDLRVESGGWILQNAAGGVTARILAQLAADRGVNVVGLVRRAADIEVLAADGIERIVATDSEGWQDRVLEASGGARFAAAVDSVGGPDAAHMLALVEEGGELVSFAAQHDGTLTLQSSDLIFQQKTVRGFWGGKVFASLGADGQRALIGELLRVASNGIITLPVGGIFGFDDIAAAVTESRTAGRGGKVLLRP